MSASRAALAWLLSGWSILLGGGADPIDAVECPGWWFPAGWAGPIAAPLAAVTGVAAARVTGESLMGVAVALLVAFKVIQR